MVLFNRMEINTFNHMRLFACFPAASQTLANAAHHCRAVTFSIFEFSRMTQASSRGSDVLKVSGMAGNPALGLLNSDIYRAHLGTQPSIPSSCADSLWLLLVHWGNFSWFPQGSTWVLYIPRNFFYLWWYPDKHYYPVSSPGRDWLRMAYDS